ncbi:AlpA family phage regulatory protein [Caballeronia sp. NCTM5]|uniref:helix-turn-helix transcriptional regulator n=1 Tax=Caballeronia sp. NCTM5 TaxID=2921755 RepID=UPI0020291290|nr:AlpA family phage regulatory protein [Caballeronia sp. NCTM5]
MAYPKTPKTAHGELPQAGYIRLTKVLEVVPFSGATLARRVQDGAFPAPVKLGPRLNAWRVDDVRKWIAEQGIEQHAEQV